VTEAVTSICRMAIDDLVLKIEEFHGYRSPGILMGSRMIETALQGLGETPYLNMVSETVVCLPDAVQLLTGCTMGNGFLQILDWGKFAVTAYDRTTLEGVRVWLNPDRLEGYPMIRAWFKRNRNGKPKPPFEDMAAEILAAESALLPFRRVRLLKPLKNDQPVPTRACPDCGEFYPERFGDRCPACRGDTYYR
jgi:formylmethanofuran dehydrogenase subunit E